MHPDMEELRPRLKEVLYDCAVDIRATKAALYVSDGAGRFELVTEYGFRGTTRQNADLNDPIVDRCGRGRTPFFVNGLAVEPRFSQILYEAGTDRMLAAPLYSRGKLVGLIDMRDKQAKAAFDEKDARAAQKIADRIMEIFADRNLFGQRFIALSSVGSGADEERAEPAVAKREATATARPGPREVHTPPRPAAAEPPPPAPADAAAPEPRAAIPSLARLVMEARAAVNRIPLASIDSGITESELTVAREALRAILLIPGAEVASFSAFGHLGGVQEVGSRSRLNPEALKFLQSKLNVWLSKRGESGGFLQSRVTTPLGDSGQPVSAADLARVFTAPLIVGQEPGQGAALSHGQVKGLYLTVAFSGNPDRAAHELLGALHAHLQLVLEQSLSRAALSSLRHTVAMKLLEPEFESRPDLRRHSELVARLAEGFARSLGMPEQEIDTLRLAALVHDCGMRLLDYERLYRRTHLTEEELGFLREHPSVGAAMVEPLLGPEIARIVLHHHERVDGTGYPGSLREDDIPLPARVLALCDAWFAMTDPETYQPPISESDALATLGNTAGTQFDAALTPRFVQWIRSGGAAARRTS